MPPWWGRRRTKSTAIERSKRDEENPQSPSSIKAHHQKEKTKSFDEAFAAKNPVKNNNNNNIVGSGFVFAFESDGPPSSGRGRRDLPLPRPSDSAAAAAGSGSGSVSSVSSSESSCEAVGAETGLYSENGQMCAIKEVKDISDDQASKESLRQLNQEIVLLSQLSHPNIVQYYGSELIDDTLSVYLEYVSGGSIHKLLQDYGPFREPVIRSYTGQILSGLAYLHGRNHVHRDIKGANILVDPNGEIKLADFGMAKHISSYTSIRSFKGSPYWMAPEVIMNGNGYNLAVDIWSLGCTILEMVTSKPPWSQYEGVRY
ncbi:Mitogen-activated protein kinase kinase kinase YODA [Acorus calamus]|uniref:Mitogen-activated protein kinase kinase kinase YODA n=1 Tax=Acorus calamus TaxID=4465 RepID=A0AAV9E992_ACOCL|nr:Mitogen-activated protein kinase kinase kinase YODA [Acorus calamus]